MELDEEDSLSSSTPRELTFVALVVVLNVGIPSFGRMQVHCNSARTPKSSFAQRIAGGVRVPNAHCLRASRRLCPDVGVLAAPLNVAASKFLPGHS